jgi:hypothetical protein
VYSASLNSIPCYINRTTLLIADPTLRPTKGATPLLFNAVCILGPYLPDETRPTRPLSNSKMVQRGPSLPVTDNTYTTTTITTALVTTVYTLSLNNILLSMFRKRVCQLIVSIGRKAHFPRSQSLPCNVPQTATVQASVGIAHSLNKSFHRAQIYGYYTWGGASQYTRFGSQNRNGGPRRGGRYPVVLVVGGAGVIVVWATSRQEIPYTGRMHAILVNTATERALGEQTFRQVINEARANGSLLPPSHPASLAVRRIGTRIAAVAGDGVGGGAQDHMKDLHWEFAVIKSPEVNAFVVPGGKVVVYTGLLRLVTSEDELAAVLAHEVAHVVARHAAERMTQGSVAELVRMIAYWGFGLPIPQGAMVAAFFLPNSRKAETEADVIGIQLAARACYDPASAVEVFTKLGREEAKHSAGHPIPKLLRTHPVTSDRVTSIKKMLPRAEALGESAGCGVSGRRLRRQFERDVSDDRLGRRVGVVDWTTVLGSVR